MSKILKHAKSQRTTGFSGLIVVQATKAFSIIIFLFTYFIYLEEWETEKNRSREEEVEGGGERSWGREIGKERELPICGFISCNAHNSKTDRIRQKNIRNLELRIFYMDGRDPNTWNCWLLGCTWAGSWNGEWIWYQAQALQCVMLVSQVVALPGC